MGGWNGYEEVLKRGMGPVHLVGVHLDPPEHVIDVGVEHARSVELKCETNCISAGAPYDFLAYRMICNKGTKLVFQVFGDNRRRYLGPADGHAGKISPECRCSLQKRRRQSTLDVM
jgi:hypothetical protein